MYIATGLNCFLSFSFPVIMDAHHRSRTLRLTSCFFLNIASLRTIFGEGLRLETQLDTTTVVCHLWCSNLRHLALGTMVSFTFFTSKYLIAAWLRPQQWTLAKANITREYVYPINTTATTSSSPVSTSSSMPSRPFAEKEGAVQTPLVSPV